MCVRCLNCITSSLRLLFNCLDHINITRNKLMLVIFCFIDSHRTSCSKMNCTLCRLWGVFISLCCLFEVLSHSRTPPLPPQLTLSWLSCRRNWGKQSWWWRTLFPMRSTVQTGGWTSILIGHFTRPQTPDPSREPSFLLKWTDVIYRTRRNGSIDIILKKLGRLWFKR